MCGIAGIVGSGAAEHVTAVRVALRALSHRGPDDEGVAVTDYAVLGMRRLAIIDLSGGRQPAFNESRSIAAVCNGEIYNYRELASGLRQRGHTLASAGDVETLPHLFEELGAAAIEQCRGMFAVAIADRVAGRVYLARDRFGKKPLYWAQRSSLIYFASELPALLSMIPEVPRVSEVALRLYLQLGYVPHPYTAFEHVSALPPASVLTIESGRQPLITTYWTPDINESFRGSEDDALSELDSRLEDSIRVRLQSDVPIGLFLSGGIDSGLIASYLVRLRASDTLCFTVGVDDPVQDESAAAARTAAHLGMPVRHLRLSADIRSIVESIPLRYGQPFADASAIPSLAVSALAARERKVVLNGDGGDELFAGYRRYWAAGALGSMRGADELAAVHACAARVATLLGDAEGRTMRGFAARFVRSVATRDPNRYVTLTANQFNQTELETYFPDLAHVDGLEGLAHVRGYDIRTNSLRALRLADLRLGLADGLLVKMDIASMAASVEARSPFLDHQLYEFVATLPTSWLFSWRKTKPLLRKLASRTLTPDVARGKKRGFEIPLKRWLSVELFEFVRDLLLAPDARIANVGNHRAIRQLVEGKRPFTGNLPQAVWAMLILELHLRNGPFTNRASG